MSRPGFGVRHPALASILTRLVPVASHEIAWLDGAMPLRVSAFAQVADLPDELISSVRCIVRVADLIVYCENREGKGHPWPGGRRLPGESLRETAAREVEEETGWLIEPGSIEQLGWLHLEHLAPPRPGDSSPYPDFLQVVVLASASDRLVEASAPWVDTDGFEVSSRLVSLEEAMASTSEDLLARSFLELLRDRWR